MLRVGKNMYEKRKERMKMNCYEKKKEQTSNLCGDRVFRNFTNNFPFFITFQMLRSIKIFFYNWFKLM